MATDGSHAATDRAPTTDRPPTDTAPVGGRDASTGTDRSLAATAKSISSRQTFEVVDPVDADGRLTVVETVTDTPFHVVDYADPMVRDRLADRDPGATVRLDLAPADPDGLDWMVTRVLPGAPAPPDAEFY